MIRQWISEQVKALVYKAYAVEIGMPAIEVPNTSDYGDFATNVAFGLARQLKKAPNVIANELCAEGAKNDNGLGFSQLNGFVNLRLSNECVFKLLSEWTAQSIRTVDAPQSILMEFVSANPTGPLHIGHGRWAVIGSCLATLLKRVGHSVSSEFYVNDAGNQIALYRDSVAAVRDGIPVPENGYRGSYIQEVTDAPDPVEAMRLRHESTLGRIGVAFDRWFSERSLHECGAVENSIAELRKRGVMYELDGAVWFRSTDFGDDKDRVLVKNDGSYTYFAVDCAYHLDKLGRSGDRMINIWGADHHGYVARVRAVVTALGGEEWSAKDRFTVIIGQLVTLLKDGEPVRMSKRTGEMVTLDEIVDEIGVDATRFFLAMKNADSTIDFDLEIAKKKSNENPVYYVQYAHARICAIFRKTGIDTVAPPRLVHLNDAEKALILACLQYQDELHSAAQNFAPNRLIYYLIEVARLVHSVYEASPIVNAEANLRAQRLFILGQAKQCISDGLRMVGVSAPTEM